MVVHASVHCLLMRSDHHSLSSNLFLLVTCGGRISKREQQAAVLPLMQYKLSRAVIFLGDYYELDRLQGFSSSLDVQRLDCGHSFLNLRTSEDYPNPDNKPLAGI